MSTSSGETKFSVLVSLFRWMRRTKSSPKKRSKFRKFLDSFCHSSDYFSPIRLILPSLDRERGTYGLKESVLATCLVDALGMSRDSPDAQRLFNWRRGGPRTGANAGNFALVAAEVLQLRQGSASRGLTIKELNDLLDSLAAAETRSEKTNILSTLIKRTNADEMKWIVMIILKDLKLGISEKSIFHEFHPDAEDLFNVTCDLKLVCEKLKDRGRRHKRQDIEVGKAVRPQLALRVANAAAAWKKLHGKEVVVECKFDGDRIQVHKNGTDIHFFSRNFLDHTEYRPGMSKVILENILVDRCILDGEMLVWDSSLNLFAEFGSNQEIAKAARDGLDTDRQLCYVAFDILYAGDTSVIHQSLKERHELLLKVIRPVKGRLEILIPDVGRASHHPPGEACWSMVTKSLDDVERFFKETVENRDEGVVFKDLGSKWEPGDRSGKWLKLKPDYIHPSSDLDVLIMGGYYGSGRLGGEVAQFLVGLAERPASNAFPRRFWSFCRVGTGLTDEERNALVTKLKPYLRKQKEPPNFYQVTNHSKERPDVWVDSPEKSIVVSITSDIRTIRSEVFAAPYSLRFPRIDRVRWDKPWHDCLDVQSFLQLVHTSNGTTHIGKEYESQQIKHRRSSQMLKGEKKDLSKVPSHFARTDISGIKGESKIFANMMFYFANVPSSVSLDSVHKMVVKNGGFFSMNLNDLVTHCIAAESKGIKYHAAKQRRDVIHSSWFFDCCERKKLQPLQPKHFLFISGSSKRNLQEDIDEFSDSYYWDLDMADIKQLLSNVERSESPQNVEYYKKKFHPPEKWSCFHGCRIYFSSLLETLKPEWTSLLKIQQARLGLEVCWRGGEVTKDLGQATLVVVLTIPESAIEVSSFLKSLTEAEKRLLRMKTIPLVDSNWLDSCLESGLKLPEDSFKLKINLEEESTEKECALEADLGGIAVGLNTEGRQTLSSSLDEVPETGKAAIGERGTMDELKIEGTRKRGRTTSSSLMRGNRGVTQTCRPWRRPGKKAAKISQNVTDNSSPDDSSDGHVKVQGDNQSHVSGSRELSKNPINDNVGQLQPSKRGGVAELLDTKNQDDDCVDDKEMKGEGKSDRPDVERPNEMEADADPVQAMLFDMIPSLGIRKVEASKGPSEIEKPTAEVVEPNEEPPKKKKVSYKDIAGELLKDWEIWVKW